MFETFRYCTVIITVGDDMGTGFIVSYSKGEHVIITNKHVIENIHDHVYVSFNLARNGTPINFPRYKCKLFIDSGDIINHPVMDLCGIRLNPYLDHIRTSLMDIVKNSDKSQLSIEVIPDDVYDIYYKCVHEDMFAHPPLNFIEDILIIGYPLGQHDKFNYTPIYRKGITATDPNLDYNNQPQFLIDCACFPGSSGSPVFIYNLSSSKLLGILCETPLVNDNTNLPGKKINNYTRGHLGLVIRVTELLLIKELLLNNPCLRNTHYLQSLTIMDF